MIGSYRQPCFIDSIASFIFLIRFIVEIDIFFIFFIEKILGRPDGQWAIDVYQAVDMGICGILAFRSILDGNRPVRVPDLRDPAQRDAWRNDRACTDPKVAGDQLLPCSAYPERAVSDEEAGALRARWLENHPG